MCSPDLQEFAASRTQNFYACRSSALCSLSVTLMHAQRVFPELKRGNNVHSVRNSWLLTTTLAELGVCQLAARILFEDVAQLDSTRTLRLVQICRREAPSLFLNRVESRLS
jgi:hypothetical protein